MVSPIAGHLRSIRRERRIGATELAKAVGVSRTTIWSWESGRHQPSLDDLSRVAEVLGVGVAQLYGEQAPAPESESQGGTESATVQFGRMLARLERRVEELAASLIERPPELPVLARLSAGSGGAFAEAPAVYVTSASPKPRHALRAIEIEIGGDSMEPEILPGDTLLMDTEALPINGDVVAAVIPERDGYLVKRFFRRNGNVELRPNEGAPIVLPAEAVRVIGVVFQVIRPIARGRRLP